MKALNPVKISPYHKRLLFFLSIATFFDGYDFMALIQLLPNIRQNFSLHEGQGGLLVAMINTGAVAAWFLMRAADRYGRKKLLNITIAGYTLSTFATGLAPDVYSFVIFQFLARFFIIAESAIAMVMVAEEFPADKRGMAIGIIQGSLSLGMIFCAAVVPVLLNTGYGWRSVFFVGIIPLILIAWARRSMKETRRFEVVLDKHVTVQSVLQIWTTPYRKRLILMGIIWFSTYLCTQSAVTFWKEFAVAERSLTDTQVGIAISLASLLAMPLVFMAGRLLDVIGRRNGAIWIYTIEMLAVFFCYTLEGMVPLTLVLIAGVFGPAAVMVVLNTYTSEIFPTLLRGNAFAWANNLIGRTGFIISPLIVGMLAMQYGWAFSVKLTISGLITALILILVFLPETNKKELEETSLI